MGVFRLQAGESIQQGRHLDWNRSIGWSPVGIADLLFMIRHAYMCEYGTAEITQNTEVIQELIVISFYQVIPVVTSKDGTS